MRFMRWTLVLAAVVAFAACGKSQPQQQPAPAPAPPPAEPARESAKPPAPVTMAPKPDDADGTCTLTSTGAFAATETSSAAAQSKFWMSAAELGGANQGFVISCRGKQVRLSFVSNPNTTVALGPKTYTVKGKNPEVALLGRADKSLSDFAGTLAITAFDTSHIAGTVDVTAKQDKGGKVTIKGTFDIKCTHWGKCRH